MVKRAVDMAGRLSSVEPAVSKRPEPRNLNLKRIAIVDRFCQDRSFTSSQTRFLTLCILPHCDSTPPSHTAIHFYHPQSSTLHPPPVFND